MNKQKAIGISILVTVALLVITTGVVFAAGFAHGGQPFNQAERGDDSGQFWGPMHGRGWSSEEQPMHEAMVGAVADATGLSVEDIEDRLASGEHLSEVALDAGMDETAFFELMTETREAFLAEAIENGWLSEAHYQWMLEHMDGEAYGPGDGSCHGFDTEEDVFRGGRGHGMGRRGRW
jgi:hypothetical protein